MLIVTIRNGLARLPPTGPASNNWSCAGKSEPPESLGNGHASGVREPCQLHAQGDGGGLELYHYRFTVFPQRETNVQPYPDRVQGADIQRDSVLGRLLHP